jgi:aldehyde dehydrogenase (NAD+)
MNTAAAPLSEIKPTSPETDVRARIRETFERQRAHRFALAQTSAEQRIEKLERLRRAILDRQAELRSVLHADYRKPAAEADLTELQPVLGEIAHTIEHLRKWMAPARVTTPVHLFGTRSYVRYEPLGCVLLLAPWNYPFNLLMCPLLAAVAAGNTVMLRPSDKVPQTSRFMARLLADVFPEEEVASFVGPSSIANAMLELPFDHVFFTGSERVGKQVMAAAAKHLASVTLELGGQSPVVVDETADLEASAQRIVWGKFLNAGQTCVAPNHVFVHASKADAFVAAAKRYVARHYGESEAARKASPDLCRIVDPPSLSRLVDAIDRTVKAGATLEMGGEHDASERYLAPTILSGVRDDHAIMEAEIFGPVLPVLVYRDVEEVLASIRKRGKPLAMYVFSESPANVERLVGGTTAGGTVINNCVLHLANPELPFGGVGASGQGNYHGWYGFRTFSHERAVMEQGRPATIKLFYPPYGPRVMKAISVLTRWLS